MFLQLVLFQIQKIKNIYQTLKLQVSFAPLALQIVDYFFIFCIICLESKAQEQADKD